MTLSTSTRRPSTTHGALAQIRQFIRQRGIRLVVLDTLSKWWAIDNENDNAEVIRRTGPWLDMARETGAAVVLVHHESKTGGAGGRGIRGGPALGGLADQLLELDRRPGGSLTQRVLRVLGRYESREFVIEKVGTEYRNLGTETKLKAKSKSQKILKALSAENFRPVEEIIAETGLNQKVVRPILKKLEEEGLAEAKGTDHKGSPLIYRRADKKK